MSDVDVRDNPAKNRYEAWLGDDLAGFAEYDRRDDAIAFTHTEVDDRFEGRGVGGALARGALDDVRAGGRYAVVPLCPFIRSWIDKHPDYQDLLQQP